MNDFNRGALQIPCLRLDYGFGEQWASVELGDGTGYVRLADYENLASENAKLRELVKNLHACNGSCPRCIELMGKCEYEEQLREFGIEVDE